MRAWRECACVAWRGGRGAMGAALILLLVVTLTAADLEEKRSDMSPLPFVMGSRYGRSSGPKMIVSRNDRFFMGSRYGKRSESVGAPAGSWEGVTGVTSAESVGGTALLCEYTGVLPLYRCVKHHRRDYSNSMFKYKHKIMAIEKLAQDNHHLQSKMLKYGNHSCSVEDFAHRYQRVERLVRNANKLTTYRRVAAYRSLAARLRTDVWTAYCFENIFRKHYYYKIHSLFQEGVHSSDQLPSKPSWLKPMEKKLQLIPKLRAQQYNEHPRLSPDELLDALSAQALKCGTLQAPSTYLVIKEDVLPSARVEDLQDIWFIAQKLSMKYVRLSGRSGDAYAIAPALLRVADVVVLLDDEKKCRLVTDESEQMYLESEALSLLWCLIRHHQIEHAQKRERTRRWMRVWSEYCATGRQVSIVVLQRRWYELKRRARAAVLGCWRRACDNFYYFGYEPPREIELPMKMYLDIVRKYPDIVLKPLPSWRVLVDTRYIVTEENIKDIRLSGCCVMSQDAGSSFYIDEVRPQFALNFKLHSPKDKKDETKEISKKTKTQSDSKHEKTNKELEKSTNERTVYVDGKQKEKNKTDHTSGSRAIKIKINLEVIDEKTKYEEIDGVSSKIHRDFCFIDFDPKLLIEPKVELTSLKYNTSWNEHSIESTSIDINNFTPNERKRKFDDAKWNEVDNLDDTTPFCLNTKMKRIDMSLFEYKSQEVVIAEDIKNDVINEEDEEEKQEREEEKEEKEKDEKEKEEKEEEKEEKEAVVALPKLVDYNSSDSDDSSQEDAVGWDIFLSLTTKERYVPKAEHLAALLDVLSEATASNPLMYDNIEYCCLARKYWDMSNARQRPTTMADHYYFHQDSTCECCCIHLLTGSSEDQLKEGLSVLHELITRCTRVKSSTGTNPSKKEEIIEKKPQKKDRPTFKTSSTSKARKTTKKMRKSPDVNFNSYRDKLILINSRDLLLPDKETNNNKSAKPNLNIIKENETSTKTKSDKITKNTVETLIKDKQIINKLFSDLKAMRNKINDLVQISKDKEVADKNIKHDIELIAPVLKQIKSMIDSKQRKEYLIKPYVSSKLQSSPVLEVMTEIKKRLRDLSNFHRSVEKEVSNLLQKIKQPAMECKREKNDKCRLFEDLVDLKDIPMPEYNLLEEPMTPPMTTSTPIPHYKLLNTCKPLRTYIRHSNLETNSKKHIVTPDKTFEDRWTKCLTNITPKKIIEDEVSDLLNKIKREMATNTEIVKSNKKPIAEDSGSSNKHLLKKKLEAMKLLKPNRFLLKNQINEKNTQPFPSEGKKPIVSKQISTINSSNTSLNLRETLIGCIRKTVNITNKTELDAIKSKAQELKKVTQEQCHEINTKDAADTPTFISKPQNTITQSTHTTNNEVSESNIGTQKERKTVCDNVTHHLETCNQTMAINLENVKSSTKSIEEGASSKINLINKNDEGTKKKERGAFLFEKQRSDKISPNDTEKPIVSKQISTIEPDNNSLHLYETTITGFEKVINITNQTELDSIKDNDGELKKVTQSGDDTKKCTEIHTPVLVSFIELAQATDISNNVVAESGIQKQNQNDTNIPNMLHVDKTVEVQIKCDLKKNLPKDSIDKKDKKVGANTKHVKSHTNSNDKGVSSNVFFLQKKEAERKGKDSKAYLLEMQKNNKMSTSKSTSNKIKESVKSKQISTKPSSLNTNTKEIKTKEKDIKKVGSDHKVSKTTNSLAKIKEKKAVNKESLKSNVKSSKEHTSSKEDLIQKTKKPLKKYDSDAFLLKKQTTNQTSSQLELKNKQIPHVPVSIKIQLKWLEIIKQKRAANEIKEKIRTKTSDKEVGTSNKKLFQKKKADSIKDKEHKQEKQNNRNKSILKEIPIIPKQLSSSNCDKKLPKVRKPMKSNIEKANIKATTTDSKKVKTQSVNNCDKIKSTVNTDANSKVHDASHTSQKAAPKKDIKKQDKKITENTHIVAHSKKTAESQVSLTKRHKSDANSQKLHSSQKIKQDVAPNTSNSKSSAKPMEDAKKSNVTKNQKKKAETKEKKGTVAALDKTSNNNKSSSRSTTKQNQVPTSFTPNILKKPRKSSNSSSKNCILHQTSKETSKPSRSTPKPKTLPISPKPNILLPKSKTSLHSSSSKPSLPQKTSQETSKDKTNITKRNIKKPEKKVYEIVAQKHGDKIKMTIKKTKPVPKPVKTQIEPVSKKSRSKIVKISKPQKVDVTKKVTKNQTSNTLQTNLPKTKKKDELNSPIKIINDVIPNVTGVKNSTESFAENKIVSETTSQEKEENMPENKQKSCEELAGNVMCASQPASQEESMPSGSKSNASEITLKSSTQTDHNTCSPQIANVEEPRTNTEVTDNIALETQEEAYIQEEFQIISKHQNINSSDDIHKRVPKLVISRINSQNKQLESSLVILQKQNSFDIKTYVDETVTDENTDSIESDLFQEEIEQNSSDKMHEAMAAADLENFKPSIEPISVSSKVISILPDQFIVFNNKIEQRQEIMKQKRLALAKDETSTISISQSLSNSEPIPSTSSELYLNTTILESSSNPDDDLLPSEPQNTFLEKSEDTANISTAQEINRTEERHFPITSVNDQNKIAEDTKTNPIDTPSTSSQPPRSLKTLLPKKYLLKKHYVDTAHTNSLTQLKEIVSDHNYSSPYIIPSKKYEQTTKSCFLQTLQLQAVENSMREIFGTEKRVICPSDQLMIQNENEKAVLQNFSLIETREIKLRFFENLQLSAVKKKIVEDPETKRKIMSILDEYAHLNEKEKATTSLTLKEQNNNEINISHVGSKVKPISSMPATKKRLLQKPRPSQQMYKAKPDSKLLIRKNVKRRHIPIILRKNRYMKNSNSNNDHTYSLTSIRSYSDDENYTRVSVSPFYRGSQRMKQKKAVNVDKTRFGENNVVETEIDNDVSKVETNNVKIVQNDIVAGQSEVFNHNDTIVVKELCDEPSSSQNFHPELETQNNIHLEEAPKMDNQTLLTLDIPLLLAEANISTADIDESQTHDITDTLQPVLNTEIKSTENEDTTVVPTDIVARIDNFTEQCTLETSNVPELNFNDFVKPVRQAQLYIFPPEPVKSNLGENQTNNITQISETERTEIEDTAIEALNVITIPSTVTLEDDSPKLYKKVETSIIPDLNFNDFVTPVRQAQLYNLPSDPSGPQRALIQAQTHTEIVNERELFPNAVWVFDESESNKTETQISEDNDESLIIFPFPELESTQCKILQNNLSDGRESRLKKINDKSNEINLIQISDGIRKTSMQRMPSSSSGKNPIINVPERRQKELRSLDRPHASHTRVECDIFQPENSCFDNNKNHKDHTTFITEAQIERLEQCKEAAIEDIRNNKHISKENIDYGAIITDERNPRYKENKNERQYYYDKEQAAIDSEGTSKQEPSVKIIQDILISSSYNIMDAERNEDNVDINNVNQPTTSAANNIIYDNESTSLTYESNYVTDHELVKEVSKIDDRDANLPEKSQRDVTETQLPVLNNSPDVQFTSAQSGISIRRNSLCFAEDDNNIDDRNDNTSKKSHSLLLGYNNSDKQSIDNSINEEIHRDEVITIEEKNEHHNIEGTILIDDDSTDFDVVCLTANNGTHDKNSDHGKVSTKSNKSIPSTKINNQKSRKSLLGTKCAENNTLGDVVILDDDSVLDDLDINDINVQQSPLGSNDKSLPFNNLSDNDTLEEDTDDIILEQIENDPSQQTNLVEDNSKIDDRSGKECQSGVLEKSSFFFDNQKENSIPISECQNRPESLSLATTYLEENDPDGNTDSINENNVNQQHSCLSLDTKLDYINDYENTEEVVTLTESPLSFDNSSGNEQTNDNIIADQNKHNTGQQPSLSEDNRKMDDRTDNEETNQAIFLPKKLPFDNLSDNEQNTTVTKCLQKRRKSSLLEMKYKIKSTSQEDIEIYNQSITNEEQSFLADDNENLDSSSVSVKPNHRECITQKSLLFDIPSGDVLKCYPKRRKSLLMDIKHNKLFTLGEDFSNIDQNKNNTSQQQSYLSKNNNNKLDVTSDHKRTKQTTCTLREDTDRVDYNENNISNQQSFLTADSLNIDSESEIITVKPNHRNALTKKSVSLDNPSDKDQTTTVFKYHQKRRMSLLMDMKHNKITFLDEGFSNMPLNKNNPSQQQPCLTTNNEKLDDRNKKIHQALSITQNSLCFDNLIDNDFTTTVTECPQKRRKSLLMDMYRKKKNASQEDIEINNDYNTNERQSFLLADTMNLDAENVFEEPTLTVTQTESLSIDNGDDQEQTSTDSESPNNTPKTLPETISTKKISLLEYTQYSIDDIIVVQKPKYIDDNYILKVPNNTNFSVAVTKKSSSFDTPSASDQTTTNSESNHNRRKSVCFSECKNFDDINYNSQFIYNTNDSQHTITNSESHDATLTSSPEIERNTQNEDIEEDIDGIVNMDDDKTITNVEQSCMLEENNRVYEVKFNLPESPNSTVEETLKFTSFDTSSEIAITATNYENMEATVADQENSFTTLMTQIEDSNIDDNFQNINEEQASFAEENNNMDERNKNMSNISSRSIETALESSHFVTLNDNKLLTIQSEKDNETKTSLALKNPLNLDVNLEDLIDIIFKILKKKRKLKKINDVVDIIHKIFKKKRKIGKIYDDEYVTDLNEIKEEKKYCAEDNCNLNGINYDELNQLEGTVTPLTKISSFDNLNDGNVQIKSESQSMKELPLPRVEQRRKQSLYRGDHGNNINTMVTAYLKRKKTATLKRMGHGNINRSLNITNEEKPSVFEDNNNNIDDRTESFGAVIKTENLLSYHNQNDDLKNSVSENYLIRRKKKQKRKKNKIKDIIVAVCSRLVDKQSLSQIDDDNIYTDEESNEQVPCCDEDKFHSKDINSSLLNKSEGTEIVIKKCLSDDTMKMEGTNEIDYTNIIDSENNFKWHAPQSATYNRKRTLNIDNDETLQDTDSEAGTSIQNRKKIKHEYYENYNLKNENEENLCCIEDNITNVDDREINDEHSDYALFDQLVYKNAQRDENDLVYKAPKRENSANRYIGNDNDAIQNIFKHKIKDELNKSDSSYDDLSHKSATISERILYKLKRKHHKEKYKIELKAHKIKKRRTDSSIHDDNHNMPSQEINDTELHKSTTSQESVKKHKKLKRKHHKTYTKDELASKTAKKMRSKSNNNDTSIDETATDERNDAEFSESDIFSHYDTNNTSKSKNIRRKSKHKRNKHRDKNKLVFDIAKRQESKSTSDSSGHYENNTVNNVSNDLGSNDVYDSTSFQPQKLHDHENDECMKDALENQGSENVKSNDDHTEDSVEKPKRHFNLESAQESISQNNLEKNNANNDKQSELESDQNTTLQRTNSQKVLNTSIYPKTYSTATSKKIVVVKINENNKLTVISTQTNQVSRRENSKICILEDIRILPLSKTEEKNSEEVVNNSNQSESCAPKQLSNNQTTAIEGPTEEELPKVSEENNQDANITADLQPQLEFSEIPLPEGVPQNILCDRNIDDIPLPIIPNNLDTPQDKDSEPEQPKTGDDKPPSPFKPPLPEGSPLPFDLDLVKLEPEYDIDFETNLHPSLIVPDNFESLPDFASDNASWNDISIPNVMTDSEYGDEVQFNLPNEQESPWINRWLSNNSAEQQNQFNQSFLPTPKYIGICRPFNSYNRQHSDMTSYSNNQASSAWYGYGESNHVPIYNVQRNYNRSFSFRNNNYASSLNNFKARRSENWNLSPPPPPPPWPPSQPSSRRASRGGAMSANYLLNQVLDPHLPPPPPPPTQPQRQLLPRPQLKPLPRTTLLSQTICTTTNSSSSSSLSLSWSTAGHRPLPISATNYLNINPQPGPSRQNLIAPPILKDINSLLQPNRPVFQRNELNVQNENIPKLILTFDLNGSPIDLNQGYYILTDYNVECSMVAYGILYTNGKLVDVDESSWSYIEDMLSTGGNINNYDSVANYNRGGGLMKKEANPFANVNIMTVLNDMKQCLELMSSDVELKLYDRNSGETYLLHRHSYRDMIILYADVEAGVLEDLVSKLNAIQPIFSTVQAYDFND